MSDVAQFLQAIVPDDELLCIAHVRNVPAKGRVKAPWTQKFFTPQQAANGVLAEHLAELNKHKDTDVYTGVASYTSRKRERKNVSRIQCVLLDVDLKGDRPHYTNKRDAVLGVLKLYKEVRCLPKPWIIDSGHGIHAYFVFDRPVTVNEWQPVANTFSKVAEAVDPRLLADPKPTKDAARVMRLPQTWNAKHESRQYCSVKGAGKPVSFDDLRTGLAAEAKTRNVWVKDNAVLDGPLISGSAPPVHAAGAAKSLAGGFDKKSEFKDLPLRPIISGCGQMRRISSKFGDVPEPEWMLMLRVLNTCKDADKAAQKFSSGHPSYRPSEVRFKMNHIRKNFDAATVSCDEFRETCGAKHCFHCPWRDKVWTPSQIPAREKKAEVTKKRERAVVQDALKGKRDDKGFLPHPPDFHHRYTNESRERVTTIPVFKGREEGYQQEGLIFGHLHLIGASEQIDTYEDGTEVRVNVMIHMKVETWNKSCEIAVPFDRLTSHQLDRATEPLRKVGVAFRADTARESTAIRNYLSRIARLCATRPVPYFNTKGWTPFGALTLGARRYLPDGSTVKGYTYHEHVRQKQKQIEKFCAGRPKGKLGLWKQAISVYDGDNPYAHLLLLSGLANMLFPLMPSMRGGILLALTGEAGKGKTTLIKAMNSFVGDPDEGVVQGDSTINSLMDMLKQSSVFLLPVDDMVNMSRETVSALLTTVTSGKPRIRLEQAADGGWAPSENVTLNSSLLLTSNYSTSAAFGGKGKGDSLQLEAAQSRQLEIPAEYTIVEGVSMERWERAADLLIENNGHALEQFAQYVVTNRAAVKRRLTEYQKLFRQGLAGKLGEQAKGQYRFWVRYLAAVMSTAEICRALNLVDWNPQNIGQAGVTLATQQHAMTDQTQDSDMEALWDLLTDDQMGKVNINLSEFTASTDDGKWPHWADETRAVMRSRQRKWGQGKSGMFANISNPVINSPNWRVLATEVSEKGKLKQIERAVEIPIRTLRTLVEKDSALAAENWEELYRALLRTGAKVYGVNHARPSFMSEPPKNVFLKASEAEYGAPHKGVLIVFPPIPAN